MTITKEKLAAANKSLTTMNIKGRNYATVATRLNAFRAICPDGTIDTTVCDVDDERVLIQAKIYDETGHLLASGTAEEEKEASRINSTSYVENCETSAIGRALANAGIGSEENISSADELANALMNQRELLSGKRLLSIYCSEHALDAAALSDEHGLDKVPKGQKWQYYELVAQMMKERNE